MNDRSVPFDTHVEAVVALLVIVVHGEHAESRLPDDRNSSGTATEAQQSGQTGRSKHIPPIHTGRYSTIR